MENRGQTSNTRAKTIKLSLCLLAIVLLITAAYYLYLSSFGETEPQLETESRPVGQSNMHQPVPSDDEREDRLCRFG